MASEVKADKLSPSGGTALQIGDASDTITIPTGATFTITDGLGVAGGGTGLTGFTAGDVLYATGTTTLAKLAKGTAEQVLAMNSGATAPDWGSVDLTVLPTITVAKGGTNLSSFTAGDVLYATGSTTLAKLAKGSAADVLTMNSGATAPEWSAPAGGGKVLNVIGITNSTRTAFSASNDFDFIDTTYTQVQANSKIGVVALLNGYTNGSAICNLNLTYDTTDYLGVGAWQYTGSNVYQKMASYVVYFDGASSTGSKTFQLSYGVEIVDTATLFNVWNPNSTDQSAFPQTQSTIIITEYDM